MFRFFTVALRTLIIPLNITLYTCKETQITTEVNQISTIMACCKVFSNQILSTLSSSSYTLPKTSFTSLTVACSCSTNKQFNFSLYLGDIELNTKVEFQSAEVWMLIQSRDSCIAKAIALFGYIQSAM